LFAFRGAPAVRAGVLEDDHVSLAKLDVPRTSRRLEDVGHAREDGAISLGERRIFEGVADGELQPRDVDCLAKRYERTSQESGISLTPVRSSSAGVGRTMMTALLPNVASSAGACGSRGITD
jgi:hypothetical protein